MTSEKGLYWLAVGMMAMLLLNSATVRRAFTRVESRSLQLANQVSGRAVAALNLGEIQLRTRNLQCPRTQAAALRAQAKLGCMEALLARHQAEFARLEAQRARMEALDHMRFDMIPHIENFQIEVPKPRFIPAGGTI